MNSSAEGRGRRAAAVTAAIGVTLAGAATLVPSPGAAAVAGDCAVPFPVSELTDGQSVTGLTVTKGATPEDFGGEVLGVLKDGIAPGRDMVMMRLTSPEIDRVGGIWQGMSGSPVYAEDGRLIGAVAYGLAWGPSPVAGVTPFEDMDDYLAERTAPRVALSKAEARDLARADGVSQREAEQGFRQLEMPTSVSGLSSRRLQGARKDRPYGEGATRAAGAAGSTADLSAADLVAGGNLGATISYGDITAGGVGTVTSTCGNEVIGFGHPFTFAGQTALGMHPASAIYIQEDPVSAPFKVANLGELVGTITEDRGSGISGQVGPIPDTMGVTSAVTYRGSSRTGESRVALQDYAPDVTLYQVWANQDRMFDAWAKGSVDQTWTITGTAANGKPFTLTDGDRYTSQSDISFESPWDVADQVWLLSSLPGVTLEDVSVQGRMRNDASVWSIARIQQRQGTRWVRADEVVTRPGATVRLRAVLTNGKGTIYRTWKYQVPRRLAGASGMLRVLGGDSQWSWPEADTLDDVLSAAENGLRNDEIKWTLRVDGPRGGARSAQVTEPLTRVVQGNEFVPFQVMR